jgi:hypothetical protein
MKKIVTVLVMALSLGALWAQAAGSQADGSQQIDPATDPAYKVPWDPAKIDISSQEFTPPTYEGRTNAKATLTFAYMPYTAEARVVYACPSGVFAVADAVNLAQARILEFMRKTQADYDFLGTDPVFYHYRFTFSNLAQYGGEQMTIAGEQRSIPKTTYTMYVTFTE